MSAYAKHLVKAAILLVSASLCAQEVYRPDPDVLVRLAYSNAPFASESADRQICLAVSRDGDYRILRLQNDGQTVRLQGKMPEEQLKQLRSLLDAKDFRKLSGDHGGLIRQESESFAAELPRDENRSWQTHWLNADGERPFPSPVAKVVDWIKNFRPTNGKPFEYIEYPQVCPKEGLRYLQPSVATNEHP